MSAQRVCQSLLVVVGLVLLGGQGAFSLGLARSASAESACEPSQAAIGSSEPERAAALVEAMWAQPDQAGCILSGYGMGREELSRVLGQIQGRSDLLDRYERARAKLRVGPSSHR